MPDERQQSIREGIAAPEESRIGRDAEQKNRERLIGTPPEARPDSAMGGTSDIDSPSDESELGRVVHDRGDRRDSKR